MFEQEVCAAAGKPGLGHLGGEFNGFVTIGKALWMVAQQVMHTTTGDVDFSRFGRKFDRPISIFERSVKLLQLGVSGTAREQRAYRVGQELESLAVIDYGSLGLTHVLVGGTSEGISLGVAGLGLEDHRKVWNGTVKLA